MKKLIVTILLSLSAFTACAQSKSDGNEGPQAQPKFVQPTSVSIVAQMLTGSGFMAPPSAARQITIDILANGQVNYVRSYQDGHSTSLLLATLSPEVMTKLIGLVQNVQPGKLVDQNPSAPQCMDAPGKVYYAILADGTKLEVAAVYDCKDFVKENESSSDYEIKHVLKGLEDLSRILQY